MLTYGACLGQGTCMRVGYQGTSFFNIHFSTRRMEPSPPSYGGEKEFSPSHGIQRCHDVVCHHASSKQNERNLTEHIKILQQHEQRR